ncbi:Serpentine Receptor, class T [Caenorhabditis elegans]|uniref:Serpentine Receptor, class T n=1 Tax=Caenorhabditis elegans TaxID=6239 RepID=E4MVC7_CAEEL|nr:Serpentine Receptor, class T [Caenorhabditis elegans]CCD62824.1 Serpentine Receptor, class T [Caenorhabditis elegans]|eukprot:NP_001254010.1 Uncharacterized protein CELE_C03H5.9 [Caenorhabditis elegans]
MFVIFYYYMYTAIVLAFSVILNGVTLVINFSIRKSERDNKYISLVNPHIYTSIVFSCIQAVVDPVISVEKNVLYIFSAREFVSKNWMQVMLSIYFGLYGTVAIQRLIYSFYHWDMVVHSTFHYFKYSLHIKCWNSFAFMIGLLWSLSVYQVSHTPYVDFVIQTPLNATYGVDIQNVTYSALFYKSGDILNVLGIATGSIFLITLCIAMMAYIVLHWQIWGTQKKVKNTSAYPNFRRDVLILLGSNILISAVFLFFPVILALVLPIFNLDGHIAYLSISMLLTLYPVIVAGARLYTSRVYRSAIHRFFCGSCENDEEIEVERITV